MKLIDRNIILADMEGYSTYNNEELVTALGSGDLRAFDEIYHRFWKKYYNEAYKRLRDAPLCEEVVQTVFTELWLKREVLVIGNLTAYISVAVRNQIYAQYKSHRNLPVFEEPLEHMAESYLQADSLLQLKELKIRIESWLKTQPQKRREIFEMRFIQELSTREIGEILGISQNTVQNQIGRATKSLRDNLGDAITVGFILMAMKK